MITSHMRLGALAALALRSAETDTGAAASQAPAAPAAPADPTSPQTNPASPPATKSDAKPEKSPPKKSQVIVWVQPGHETLQIGRLYRTSPELAAQLRAGWGNDRIRLGQVTLHLVIGDVAQTLPVWDGRADAWFLDGFSPAKNPQMWGDDIMAHVGRCTAPGGTFATYTAAGHVRRALVAAGFRVERAPGFAGKRHMSRGLRL